MPNSNDLIVTIILGGSQEPQNRATGLEDD